MRRQIIIDEDLLMEELLKGGPILLWTGLGEIPGNFRGLIPTTIGKFLQNVSLKRIKKPTGGDMRHSARWQRGIDEAHVRRRIHAEQKRRKAGDTE